MRSLILAATPILFPFLVTAQQPAQQPAPTATVLHAARILDVAAGKVDSPGEVLIVGNHIREAGEHVSHPNGATVIDLGNATLMPGLIDAHVHLFLHPGAEDLQTVEESVPQRTLEAAAAAKADVLAGFTSERDMGTEGAKCADVAVRNAINDGLIPGPRMRVSCNAIDILGGHEDAIGYNPAQHVLSNADIANTADEILATMREQRKEGADFTKIYETGRDHLVEGTFTTPYQYNEAQLAAAVTEADRTGSVVGVHCTGEPGATYAAEAGVASIDHAYFLLPSTMKLMRDKQIYAVPTFAVMEAFAQHPRHPGDGEKDQQVLDFHAEQFKKQMAAGVPFAIGSDVGPFPHGTQAREYVLMVKYGMSPAETLRSGLINGAKLLRWSDAIGQLKPGFYADIIAVAGNPLNDITVLTHPTFVMKNGEILRKD
ncbi:amidohydrolase family protein [Granulicella mallensis]|uniref:Imidazolonepropionase-like amidohydrolase n=1 Tax=Granulicella mallensis TaxID=940614 RepID=A0A7W7ZL41_9BACT|nr:amidohydrolase family protein [Granulicella mallensis]MBB5061920.1 imidazolonepropionase-like amidohydrolase [Granulicella mallensis]